VPAAAACVKHPANHASHYFFILYLFFVYHLVSATACVRYPANDASLFLLFIIIYLLFII
jgi:hypothetical protein